MNKREGQDDAGKQESSFEEKSLDDQARSIEMPRKVAEGKEILSSQPD